MPTLDLIRSTGVTPSDVEPVEFDAAINQDIDALHLPNDADLSDYLDALPRVKSIFVDFPAFTDGRGFSLARLLRHRHGYEGLLVADGQLIPDQFAFALQCGFDAVRVERSERERHTAEAWQAALDAFDVTYQRGYAVKAGPATSIFDARLTAAQRTTGANKTTDPFSG